MDSPSPLAAGMGAPLVIAHRGASRLAPENTASSIREALRLGAKVVEFDVRATHDGDLVLFHDDSLDRVAGRTGTIESSARDQIGALDVGAWFPTGRYVGEKVLNLEAAIRMCLEGEATPLIEHKSGTVQAYVELIRMVEADGRVIVQSFDWEFLREFRTELPATPIGALGSRSVTKEKRSLLAALRPDWIGWGAAGLSPSELPLLRECGARIALWTVNEPDEALRWFAEGVDAIITDVPDLVAAALAEGSA